MTTSVAEIFGKSPVLPLERHMGIVFQCVQCLQRFFAAAADADWDAAEVVRGEITALEHAADDLKREIRLNMPRRLFMPVPREDLLNLLLTQDSIANKAEQMSALLLARRLQIPQAIAPQFLAFVEANVAAVELANHSVRELDELYTATFGGSAAELVAQLIHKLDESENAISAQQFELQSRLYAEEASLNPVDAVFLYQTISLTGAIGHTAETVGRRLEMLLSR